MTTRSSPFDMDESESESESEQHENDDCSVKEGATTPLSTMMPRSLSVSSAPTTSSTTGDQTSSISLLKRKVSFGSVNVREFNRIAGDHPDCFMGPPLTIDWKFYEHPPVSVDCYNGGGSPRRSHSLCAISSETRKEILQFGFRVSEQELLEAEKIASKTARQREKTRKQQELTKKTKRMIQNTATLVFKMRGPTSATTTAKTSSGIGPIPQRSRRGAAA